MMPQFDIFSFFSQLFWVFVGFSYIYLLLCFYVLPAFAVTLKIRAKKLGNINNTDSNSNLITTTTTTVFDTYLDSITSKLTNISFLRKNITHDITASYNHLVLKNEAFYISNLILLNKIKITTFFI